MKKKEGLTIYLPSPHQIEKGQFAAIVGPSGMVYALA